MTGFLDPDRYPHGTRARYVAARCRCEACRGANCAYYHARRNRSIEEAGSIVPTAGRPKVKVILKKDCRGRVKEFRFTLCPGTNGARCVAGSFLVKKRGPVCARCRERATVFDGLVKVPKSARDHVMALHLAGIGYKAVAAAASCGHQIVQGIRNGRVKQVRAGVLRRVMAVDEGARADHSIVSSAQAWARIDELAALGCTRRWMSKQLGYSWYASIFAKTPDKLRTAPTTALNAARIERLYRRVRSGELTPERATVPAGPTWTLLDKLLRAFSAEDLSRRLGYSVHRSHRTMRVFPETASKVRRFYDELAAHRDGEPMPDGWQTSARPVMPMGAEEWAKGGWSVARGISTKARQREEQELRELARKRKVRRAG